MTDHGCCECCEALVEATDYPWPKASTIVGDVTYYAPFGIQSFPNAGAFAQAPPFDPLALQRAAQALGQQASRRVEDMWTDAIKMAASPMFLVPTGPPALQRGATAPCTPKPAWRRAWDALFPMFPWRG